MTALIPIAYAAMADITVLILLPAIGILAAIPSKRKYAGVGLIWISYLFAVFIWGSSFVTVYYFWRRKILFGSLLFFGIGHIFLSLVIYIEKGLWPDLTCLLVLIFLIFVFRAAGKCLTLSARGCG